MKVLRKWNYDSHRYFKFGKPWQTYPFLFPEEKNIKCSAMNKQRHALIVSLNFTAQLFPVHLCQQAQTKQTEAENIKKKQPSTSAPQRDEFCHTADSRLMFWLSSLEFDTELFIVYWWLTLLGNCHGLSCVDREAYNKLDK